MAWIESHQSLERHPKMLTLSAALNWQIPETIGRLHMLWWWVLDFADDGDLQKYNDAHVAGAMRVGIENSSDLVNALVHARWLEREPYFRVRNWWQYAGRFLQVKYKKSPAKWQRIREQYQTGELFQELPQERLREHPLQPQTLPNQPNQPTRGERARANRVEKVVDNPKKVCENERTKAVCVETAQASEALTSSEMERPPECVDSTKLPEIPSENEAIEIASMRAIPADFASFVYADWASRQGKDAAGNVVEWDWYIRKRWPREQVEWKARTHHGNKGQKPDRVRVPGAPTQAEVSAYSREKFGDCPRHATWAVSFYVHWNDPKRAWKHNGAVIDWKIQFSTQAVRWRDRGE